MSRFCGCKGVRTCLLCEEQLGLERRRYDHVKSHRSYMYCPECRLAWPGWEYNEIFRNSHPDHEGEPLECDGVFIQEDFLTEDEEASLVQGCDAIPWDLSQSGRKKQNYGPKCNFKKRKIKCGDFDGFPAFSKFVQKEKFPSVPLLKGYQSIEQCPLEYTPDRGASIEPHIDDCWVWGERVISVNLLSDSVLTMMKYDRQDDGTKYNLTDPFNDYTNVVRINEQGFQITSGQLDDENTHGIQDFSVPLGPEYDNVVIRIPMPRRSLLVLYGKARYCMEHSVLREDIVSRRICLAYREFTPPFLPGGKCWESDGKEIVERAQNFF